MAMWLFLLAAAAEPGWTPPPVTLWPMYQGRLTAPCELRGFSFDEGEQEMRDQRATGANIAGSNQMWIPTQDPAGPHGLGMVYRPHLIDEVRQPFDAPTGVSRVQAQVPTASKTASFSMALERCEGDTRVPVASQVFTDTPDLFEAVLDVPGGDPGRYELAFTKASDNTGLWLASSEDTGGEPVVFDGMARPGQTVEMRWTDASGHEHAIDAKGQHEVVWLSLFNPIDGMAREGLQSMVWVGNWNNGGFPYYPTWFYEQFPDITMLDAKGDPIAAGMFGELKGWPSITHPVIVEGTRSYIDSFVKANQDHPNLAYWALGGECLYPPMNREVFGWPDYGENAQAFFRAWLARRYGSIEVLSASWGMPVATWEAVQAPKTAVNRAQLFDWLNFRIEAMASRFGWHSAAVRAADPDRLRAACTHGNLFKGTIFIDLGSDLSLYADTSDAIEMGQIMEEYDPDYYNMAYASAIAGLGKAGAAARLAYRWPDPDARGGATSFTPEAARRYGIEAFGSGWWHLGYIQWSGDLPDGEWGVKGTPGVAGIQGVFTDLKQLEPLAKGSWALLPRVAFYPSYRQWVLDGWDTAWTDFHRWSIQHHYNPALLWERQLVLGESEPYEAIVSVCNRELAPEAIAALVRHVDRGGGLVLVGEHAAALVDALTGHDRVRMVATVDDAAMTAALESLEVRPFVHLTATQTVRRERKSDIGAGSFEQAVDLSPRRSLGQVFEAPSDHLLRVEFNCPTYTKKPEGFEVILRVRRGGPEGPVLAENLVPASHFSDNAWTGTPLDVRCTAGETLFAEIVPQTDIPPLTLGVWSHVGKAGGARIDGQSTGGDFLVRGAFEEELPAQRLVEAFILFDGWEYLVPLFSLANETVQMNVSLDPALLEPGSQWEAVDALTGEPVETDQVRIEPWQYRVLRFMRKTDRTAVEAALWRVTHRDEGEQDLIDPILLARAQTDFDEGRIEKAAAGLARIESTPATELVRCELDDAGALQVALRVTSPQGGPFEGGVAVVRVMPLPGVAAVCAEKEPGLYEGVIPAHTLTTYDYARRAYQSYEGPLEVVANVWQGQTLAQCTKRIR